MVQEQGRSEILLDYHLRVGQITLDTHVPVGQMIQEQRLDETEIGEGTAVTLVDAGTAAALLGPLCPGMWSQPAHRRPGKLEPASCSRIETRHARNRPGLAVSSFCD